MNSIRQTAVLACFIIIGVGKANAQNPTITVLQDLSFGTNVTRTTTIAYNSSAAAKFAVQFPTYSQQGNVSITFILPANLTDAAGDNLPISFSGNSAAYNVGTNSTHGAISFDPNYGLSGTLGQNSHTDYFWLGGTVTPGYNYTASTYVGTITVSVIVTVGTNQYTADETITVTATLVGNVSLSATGSLNFGTIIAGTTPPSIVAQSGSAAAITASVRGGGGRQITVDYPGTTSLNGSSGLPLTFTPSVYGTNVSGDQAGATVVTSGSSVTLSGSHRQTGYYYFWVGGALDAVPANQVPGNYVGNFWITVTY